MKDNKFAALAAIKAFYELGNEFTEIFASFVLQVLAVTPMSIEIIKRNVKDEFDIDIPLDVLKTIIKRLRRYDYVDYEEFKSIQLKDKGRIKKEENKRDIDNKQRENNALFKNLQEFINKSADKEIDIDQIRKELGLFIQANSYIASFLLSGEQLELKYNRKFSNYIVEYFIKTEKDDPINFDRLKSLVYGEIISSVLMRKNFQREAKFEKFDVYLDTNIVFSLMGLHDELLNKSTEELIGTIKKLGFGLKVFSFTKDEIVYKLKNYLYEYDFYTKEIEVNSIYFNLKRKDFSKQDIVLLVEKIENEFQKIGILIDYSFDLNELIKNKQDSISDLGIYKNKDKDTYPIKHDIAAIETIKKIRNRQRFNLIEKSKAIFLTADIRLYKFNLIKYNLIDQIVPEIIFRSDLASILWLKCPELNSNLPIHNLITGNTGESLIDQGLWDRFIYELKKQRSCGNIDENDINILISSNETKNILYEIQSGKQDENNIGLFIDKEIKKRKKEESTKNKENINLKQENNHLKKLVEQFQNSQMEEAEKLNKRIEKICREKSHLSMNITLMIIGSILLFGVGFLILRNGIMGSSNLIGAIVTLILVPSLIFSLIKRKRIRILDFLINFIEKVENKKIEKCIKKRKGII